MKPNGRCTSRAWSRYVYIQKTNPKSSTSKHGRHSLTKCFESQRSDFHAPRISSLHRTSKRRNRRVGEQQLATQSQQSQHPPAARAAGMGTDDEQHGDPTPQNRHRKSRRKPGTRLHRRWRGINTKRSAGEGRTNGKTRSTLKRNEHRHAKIGRASCRERV